MVKWNTHIKEISNNQVFAYAIDCNNRILTFRQVIDLWCNDAVFREYFIDKMSSVEFDAYRWETPAISNHLIDRDFEFVLVNSPRLARPQKDQAFSEYFSLAAPGQAVQFPGLGKDSVLIVPNRLDNAADYYCHLASFSRRAPVSQQHALWRLVGETVLHCLNDKLLWLSTAGGAVAWLHIRIDNRPKYYRYKPYCSAKY